MNLLRTFLLVCSSLCLLGVASGAVWAGGETSTPKSADRTMASANLTAKLIPKKSTILLNEPVHFSFVLQNPTDSDLYIITGGDPDFGEMPGTNLLTVYDDAGRKLPSRPQAIAGSWLFGPHKISAHSSFVVTLFLPDFVTLTKPGTYSIVVKRHSSVSRNKSDMGDYESMQKIPAMELLARTMITVEPADSIKLGNVIDVMGTTLVTGLERDAWHAAESLRAIDDKRVVPYFVRVFNERKDAVRFAAVEKGALDKYDDPFAFAVLQNASNIYATGKDWESDPQFSRQVPDNVRFGAAIALSRSPFPEAIPFLLTRRHDSSLGVRMTVVHTMGKLGKTDPQTAIPILREMTTDKDKSVGGEAKRYLKLLSSGS